MSEEVFRGEPRGGDYVDITVDTLSLLPRGVRLIDVRQPEEFDGELGHLEGAELVPLSTAVDASRTWSKEEPLVLICRSGNRSSQAARALAQVGFKNLANLKGGMLAVRARGK